MVVLPADYFGIFCCSRDVSLHRIFDLGALYFALRCGSLSQKTSTADRCLSRVFAGFLFLYLGMGGVGVEGVLGL